MQLFYIATWQLKLLGRKGFFTSSFLVFFLLFSFTFLLSDLLPRDQGKILGDFLTFLLHVLGNVLAIYWSLELAPSPQKRSSLELFLSSQISRSKWLLGSFLGGALAFFLLSLLLFGMWKIGWVLSEQLPITQSPEWKLFAFSYLGWLVTLSLGFFFASFCSYSIAFFATLTLWLIGQLLPLYTQILETPFLREVTKILDFQVFNASRLLENTPSSPQMFAILGYSLSLTLFFLSTSSLIFLRKDLQ